MTTPEWLAATLYRMEACRRPFADIYRFLNTTVVRSFANYNHISETCFVLSGFIYQFSPLVGESFVQMVHTGQNSLSKLVFRDQRSAVLVHGATDAVTVFAERRIRKLGRKGLFSRDGSTVAKKLLDIIREAARDKKLGSVIGPSAMTTFQDANADCLRCRYCPSREHGIHYTPIILNGGPPAIYRVTGTRKDEIYFSSANAPTLLEAIHMPSTGPLAPEYGLASGIIRFSAKASAISMWVLGAGQSA
jgi:hypothetical protein